MTDYPWDCQAYAALLSILHTMPAGVEASKLAKFLDTAPERVKSAGSTIYSTILVDMKRG